MLQFPLIIINFKTQEEPIIAGKRPSRKLAFLCDILRRLEKWCLSQFRQSLLENYSHLVLLDWHERVSNLNTPSNIIILHIQASNYRYQTKNCVGNDPNLNKTAILVNKAGPQQTAISANQRASWLTSVPGRFQKQNGHIGHLLLTELFYFALDLRK